MNNLHISMPQCLAAGFCALLAIGYQRSGWPWRLAAYVLPLAIFSSATYFLAMNWGLLTPRLLAYVLATYLLFRLVFGLEAATAQMAALIATSATIVTTVAGTLIAILAGVAFTEYYTMEESLIAALIWYPCWFALPLLMWKWRRRISARTWDWINVLQHYHKARVLLWMLMAEMSIMTGALMSVAAALSLNPQPGRALVSICVFGLVFAATLLFCQLAVQMARELYQHSLENCLLEQTVELLYTAESQREHFQLALQELDAMAARDEQAELEIRLDSISQDLNRVNQRFMAGNTMISALLNAKLLQSEKCGINLEIVMEDPPRGAAVDLHSLELVRIIGNLLDNALDAVEDQEQESRWVRLKARKVGPLQCLTVSNPLPPRAEISESIFEPGFTGKGGSHGGLGLYIARSLADQLGGQLKFQIEPGPLLCFVLILPG